MSRNADGPDTLGVVRIFKDVSISPTTVGRTWSQFSLGGERRRVDGRVDHHRAARPRDRHAVVAVADRVGVPDGDDGDRRQGAPRCSASQIRSQRRCALAAGRNARSNCSARLGSSVLLIASSGISETPRRARAPLLRIARSSYTGSRPQPEGSRRSQRAIAARFRDRATAAKARSAST